MSGTITLNGETTPLTDGGVIAILRDLEIDPAARGLAVAVNGAVVPRAQWSEIALRDGDAVEVVKLFAGG
jgi:sulfur carrier protein